MVIRINRVYLDTAIELAIEEGNYDNDTVHMDNYIDLMEITGLGESPLMWGMPEARAALREAGIYADYQVFERDSFGVVCAGYVWWYQGLRLTWAF